jgi:hypothetical protein
MKNILIQADNLMALNFLLKERNLKGKNDIRTATIFAARSQKAKGAQTGPV